MSSGACWWRLGLGGLAGGALMWMLACPALAAPLTLVEGGAARARIVIGANATATEQLAAREFQEAIELISGATLPIVAAMGDEAAVRIVLGTPTTNPLVKAQSQRFADDLTFLAGSDGFAVRLRDGVLYIIGAEPKGVLNGVYSFLEENTSILWFRAGPEGVAYRPSDRIVAERTDYRERPAFDLRGWHLTGIWQHTHEPTELWMTRNRCNYKPTNRDLLPKVLPTLLERGLRTEFGGGHNLNFWFPNEPYFDQHPEFFAMIDGVRRPMDAQTQICFSNPQGTRAFTESVLAKVADLPPGIDTISILIQDGWNVCQCELCTQPITLADGSTLEPEDAAFRSTQFFLFLNQVAEAVYGYAPDLQIISYAYIFTAELPRVDLFRNVHIRFCPFVKSDKHTLHAEVNRKWLDRTQAWAKKTANLIWREYYGCASGFPRPLAQTVATDLQYVNGLGIRQVFSEGPPDSDKERRDGLPPQSHAWDVSSMQFWLITRLYWDPTADLDALRQRYLDRVFQEASPAMGEFYQLIHDAWYADSTAEYYNAEADNLARRYIQDAGIADACRAALEEAARLAQDEGVGRRVAAVRARFDGWMEAIAAHPTPSAIVPTAGAEVARVLNFENLAWAGATVIDGLTVMGQTETPSRERTVVRLLHDAQNLYLGFECFDSDEEGVMAPPRKGDYEQFPSGDRIELFLVGDQQDKGLYYHLAFNALGTQYEGKGYDKSWNGDWSVTTRIDSDGWRAVAVVPWATLGVTPTEEPMSALIYRFIASEDKARQEHGSWGGGAVHVSASFGKLTFDEEAN